MASVARYCSKCHDRRGKLPHWEFRNDNEAVCIECENAWENRSRVEEGRNRYATTLHISAAAVHELDEITKDLVRRHNGLD